MIYLELFLSFFKIGAISFGGGYGMISLMRETVLANNWLTDGAFIDLLAISESTPGPIAVNMATFVGSVQGGLFGSVCATAGVALPAFLVILLIACIMKKFMEYAPVRGFLSGVRPCVIALILGTGITIGLSKLFNISGAGDAIRPDLLCIILLIILAGIDIALKKAAHKKPSPVFLILISAVFGIIFL